MNVAAKLIGIVRSVRPAYWQRHPLFAGSRADPCTVLVTGATGFIGRHLCRYLVARGHRLMVLTRDRDRAVDLFGPHAIVCTSANEIESAARVDAIVNLAGEPIFARAWTPLRRQTLVESRLSVTQGLVDLIARLERKPRVLLSASAVGYYGIRGDEELTEADRGQTIYQSQLCQTWELAAQRAQSWGVRVCRLRFGVVLGNDGGALLQQAQAAQWGIRCVIGSGEQWVSWIHVEDAMRLIEHCMENGRIEGPVNATAPVPIRQRDFAAAMAGVFGRGLSIRVPALLLRRVLGERAQLLVDGQRVVPMRAQCTGFEFLHPHLPEAIADLFGQPAAEPADILYDSRCPICDTEMKGYCRSATKAGRQWRFEDVSARAELMVGYRLDLATARKRVYVLSRSGEMLSGIDALERVWAGLPRWRWLAWLLRLPLIKPVAAAFYDFVLAPLIWGWNRSRYGAATAVQDTGLSGERTA